MSIEENSTSSIEQGPPDSHEAMNNRELNPVPPGNFREKRSYEFLIGLVNNNSKYEVTRVDSTSTTMSPEGAARDVPASDVLLELMVKLAAHPQQWEKVHKLLQRLDSDLVSSKKIVDDIETTENKNSVVPNQKRHYSTNETIHHRAEKVFETTDDFSPKSFAENLRSQMKNGSKKHDYNNWPVFTPNQNTFGSEQNSPNTLKYPSSKSGYRNFRYRLVTDGATVHQEIPKAYIAVSLIAPKPIDPISSEEDLVLEKELRQLKPWPHREHADPYETLRWSKRTGKSKEEEDVP